MSDTRYDIRKLKKIDGLDIENGLRSHVSQNSYFDSLTSFIDSSKRYLRDYTPAVVVYSDEMRKNFLEDVHKVQLLLITLGMNSAAASISDLSASANGGNEKALSDGLLVFHSEMDILSEKLASARTGKTTGEITSTKPVIMAVDDMPELLASLTYMLEDEFSVIAVTSGEDAIKVIERHLPELFILDIEMPEMDGYELMRLIRRDARFSETPILFLTSKGSRGEVKAAINIGANDYILKPVNKNMLLKKIHANLIR